MGNQCVSLLEGQAVYHIEIITLYEYYVPAMNAMFPALVARVREFLANKLFVFTGCLYLACDGRWTCG